MRDRAECQRVVLCSRQKVFCAVGGIWREFDCCVREYAHPLLDCGRQIGCHDLVNDRLPAFDRSDPCNLIVSTGSKIVNNTLSAHDFAYDAAIRWRAVYRGVTLF